MIEAMLKSLLEIFASFTRFDHSFAYIIALIPIAPIHAYLSLADSALNKKTSSLFYTFYFKLRVRIRGFSLSFNRLF